jgi:hypothetical protein
MKKPLLLTLGCLFFVALQARAGQSGYILNGKLIITHKDGEPVDTKIETSKRGPASLPKVQGNVFFDEDDLARCYWRANHPDLFCIKKKNSEDK